MTAEEIRTYQKNFVELNGQTPLLMADGSAATFARMEIAAQLAELNTTLKRVIGSDNFLSVFMKTDK